MDKTVQKYIEAYQVQCQQQEITVAWMQYSRVRVGSAPVFSFHWRTRKTFIVRKSH